MRTWVAGGLLLLILLIATVLAVAIATALLGESLYAAVIGVFFGAPVGLIAWVFVVPRIRLLDEDAAIRMIGSGRYISVADSALGQWLKKQREARKNRR